MLATREILRQGLSDDRTAKHDQSITHEPCPDHEARTTKVVIIHYTITTPPNRTVCDHDPCGRSYPQRERDRDRQRDQKMVLAKSNQITSADIVTKKRSFYFVPNAPDAPDKCPKLHLCSSYAGRNRPRHLGVKAERAKKS